MSASDAAPSHSLMESDEFYGQLDPGIRFPVKVLHARGIHTQQSCEGGDGHAYDRPTIDLEASVGQKAGFAALAALEDYGLGVRDVALLWSVRDGLIDETCWRVTLWQAWPDRADEKPIFTWSYRAEQETRQ